MSTRKSPLHCQEITTNRPCFLFLTPYTSGVLNETSLMVQSLDVAERRAGGAQRLALSSSPSRPLGRQAGCPRPAPRRAPGKVRSAKCHTRVQSSLSSLCCIGCSVLFPPPHFTTLVSRNHASCFPLPCPVCLQVSCSGPAPCGAVFSSLPGALSLPKGSRGDWMPTAPTSMPQWPPLCQ